MESQDCKYNGYLAKLEKEIPHQMRTGIVDNNYILPYCDPTQMYSGLSRFFEGILDIFLLFFQHRKRKGK